MSAHTPGPWTDGREGSGDFISPAVVVLGDTGACGSCGGGPGEIFVKPADKKLIKAAPELADVLEVYLDGLGGGFLLDADKAALLRRIEGLHQNARIVLRKAGRLP